MWFDLEFFEGHRGRFVVPRSNPPSSVEINAQAYSKLSLGGSRNHSLTLTSQTRSRVRRKGSPLGANTSRSLQKSTFDGARPSSQSSLGVVVPEVIWHVWNIPFNFGEAPTISSSRTRNENFTECGHRAGSHRRCNEGGVFVKDCLQKAHAVMSWKARRFSSGRLGSLGLLSQLGAQLYKASL
jgi:hypothetical protein